MPPPQFPGMRLGPQGVPIGAMAQQIGMNQPPRKMTVDDYRQSLVNAIEKAKLTIANAEYLLKEFDDNPNIKAYIERTLEMG